MAERDPAARPGSSPSTGDSGRNIYTVGGTVQAGEGVYIHRQADEELLDLCRAGTFAYVLTARQMGKSSLMVRTAQRLAEEGVRSVIVDVTELGTHVTADEWYLGLLLRIRARLGLKANLIQWWQDLAHLGLAQRLVVFFQEVVLPDVPAPLVVFVDEIDTTLSLDFSDDFFAAIRHFYNARALEPELQRLSFVLFGVATPGDLINDPRRTPFNVGQRVDLTDFTFEEAEPLADGLGLPVAESRQVLGWALEWTGGHPYLTQRLCAYIAHQNRDGCSEADVERAVTNVFYGEMSERDNNLQFVRDMLTKRTPDLVGILKTYRDIRRGRQVRDEEQSVVKSHLKLSGVVRREEGMLRVRNPIYAEVFDLEWVRAHWPLNWWDSLPRAVQIAAGVIIVLLVGLVFTTTFALGRQQEFAAARATAEAEAAARAVEVAVRSTAEAEAVAARAAADAERERAERQAQNARQSYSRLLAKEALNLDEFDLALLLALEADRVGDTVEAKGALREILESNLFLKTYLYHGTNVVQSVAFSSDGKLLASSRDEAIVLWDMATDQPLGRPLTRHNGVVRAIAFSPDRATLASGNAAGTVVLWDISTLQPLGEPLAGHSGEIRSVTFSPDGDILASSSSDGTIILWDVVTRQPLGPPLRQHADVVRSVAFSPNGKMLASGSDDRAVILWDVATRQSLGEPLSGHTDAVWSVAFSPDGEWLAGGSRDGKIVIWDVVTRQPAGDPLAEHAGSVWSVAFSPDGNTLASGSADGAIILWDGWLYGQPPDVVLSGHTGGVRSMAFNPDGTLLASAGNDNTIILWDVGPRLQIRGSGTIQGADEDIVFYSVNDVYPTRLSRLLTDQTEDVWDLAFSPDGRLLASASSISGDYYEGAIVRNVASAQPVARYSDSAWSVAFSPDGDMLAWGDSDGTVHLWDVAARQPLAPPLVGHTNTVWSVAFSPGGQLLTSGGEDSTIILWDVATRSGVPLKGHTDAVWSLAFSPNGQLLASGSEDGTIILWDVTSHEPLGQFLADRATRVYSVAFNPAGEVLAAAGDDGIYLLDAMSGQPIGEPLTGHTDAVWSVAFSPHGQLLASGGEDGALILWDVESLQPIGRPLTVHDWVTSVAFSPDGTLLASGGRDEKILLWDVSLQSWRDRACRIANRNLSQEEWQRYLGDDPYQKTCSDLP